MYNFVVISVPYVVHIMLLRFSYRQENSGHFPKSLWLCASHFVSVVLFPSMHKGGCSTLLGVSEG